MLENLNGYIKNIHLHVCFIFSSQENPDIAAWSVNGDAALTFRIWP